MSLMIIIFLISSLVVNTFIWLLGIIPFIKPYTGGESTNWFAVINPQRKFGIERLGSSFPLAAINDYLVARKIIKGEEIKTPISVRTFEMLMWAQVILILGIIFFAT